MKNKVMLIIAFIILFVVILVLLVIILPRFANNWNIINDETCTPPCLGNIIPGTTTQQETLDTVKTNKIFGTCELIDMTQQGGITHIHCQSYKRYMNITLEDKRVTGIGIHPYPIYNVENIIARFGYPDRVSCGLVNLPDYPSRVKTILWFDKFSTSVFLSEIDADQCTVVPSLEVDFIVYDSASGYFEKKQIGEELKDDMVWEGFTTYPGKHLP